MGFLSKYSCIAAACLLSILGLVACAEPTDPETRNVTLAIQNVSILPMSTEGVLRNHTVLVADDHIVAVAPSAELTIPEDVEVVDGHGKYLLPGLADMHTHPDFETELWSYVLHGVTFIRLLPPSESNFELYDGWRATGTESDVRYPAMMLSGWTITADPLTSFAASLNAVSVGNADDARALVRKQAASGANLIKLFPRHSPAVWNAAIEEAHSIGLPVTAHAQIRVSLADVLSSGIDSLEHMNAYAYALQSEPWTEEMDWPEASWGMTIERQYWLSTDESRFTPLARRFAESGVWTVPTLAVHRGSYDLTEHDIETILESPRGQLIHPEHLELSLSLISDFGDDAEISGAAFENKLRMVKSLHDAGANIMAGTDAGNPFVLYGPGLHDELAHFVEAGLTPYEAIRTATVGPARYLGKTDEFGSIAEGLRADFLLVDANPLEDVANLKKISGIALRGRWLPKTELNEMRTAIIRLHATATAKPESDP